MTKIVVVIGTRPEAIKTAPVVDALRKRGADVAVILTGQHSGLMDDDIVARLAPAANLKIASDGSMLRFVNAAKRALKAALVEHAPKVVIVQGDTMSAFAGALAARDAAIPVVHVEAGVRSGNETNPWPEELIRVAIDQMSVMHFAPSALALGALAREGHGATAVNVGNTGVDALLRYTEVRAREEVSDTILITLHRRELRDRPDILELMMALGDAVVSAGVRAVWPVHPGMLPIVGQVNFPMSISIRPAFNYATMLRVLAESRGVLTDSGGVTEEAAVLGVPTAIWRNVHDRPEATDAGIARQFALTPQGVHGAVYALANRMIPRVPSRCFGDGAAAERIADILLGAMKTA